MKKIFKNVYENKCVLVTGHTGFKGAWLTLWLKELGAKVIGYSLEPPTKPSLFEALSIDKKIIHIIGDVTDDAKLKKVFKEHKPEIVFHLAAQALVGVSYKEPKLTYETNIIGTVNLLEAARETETVQVIINVTSDKCYENKEWVHGYRETDRAGGHDPYSSSKACSEIITSAYRKSFFNLKDFNKNHNISLASVRAGNVIGGGDWGQDRLIPDCIKSLNKNETVIIRRPNAIRPWQHVLECLSGYLALGSLMWLKGAKYAQAWNFGPNSDDVLKVEEIVKKIIQFWGKGSYTINQDISFHETTLLKLDISKAQFFLNWKPVYGVYEALEKTADWYKTYYKGGVDMYEYSLNQIIQYIEVAGKNSLEWSIEK